MKSCRNITLLETSQTFSHFTALSGDKTALEAAAAVTARAAYMAVTDCTEVHSSNHAIFSALTANQHNLSWSCLTVFLFVVGCWSPSKQIYQHANWHFFPLIHPSPHQPPWTFAVLFNHKNQSAIQKWITFQPPEEWRTCIYCGFCNQRDNVWEEIKHTKVQCSCQHQNLCACIHSQTCESDQTEELFIISLMIPPAGVMKLWLEKDIGGLCEKYHLLVTLCISVHTGELTV